jgi:hypothetical protein
MAQRDEHTEETQAEAGGIINIMDSMPHTSRREDDTQEVPLVKNLSALPYRSEKDQAVKRGSPAVWFTRWIRRAACR